MNVIQRFAILVAVLPLLLPSCKEDELPEGECQEKHMWDDKSICYVCLTTDEDELFEIGRFVSVYNDSETSADYCAQSIRVWDDVEQVDLAAPVVLDGAAELVLEPNPGDNEDRIVVFNASDAGPLPEEDRVEIEGEDRSCGLVVKADALNLKRIRVDGYPYGPGICVTGDENVLDDVASTNNAGDGIVFTGLARNNRLRGFTVSTGNEGYGILYADEAGTNNSVQAVEGLVLGENGSGAVFSHEATLVRIDPPTPATDENGDEIPDTWSVIAQVHDCGPDNPPDCDNPGGLVGGSGIQLHRAAAPSETDYLTQSFSTFVRYLDSAEIEDDGSIEFQLNEVADGTSFFLVPESDEDVPATSTDVFTLEAR
jgi:hypothetical protein